MDENNNTTVGAREGAGAPVGAKNKSVVTKLIIILIVIVVLAFIYVFVRQSSQSGEIGEGANVEQARGQEAAPPAVTESEQPSPAETAAATTKEEEPVGQAVLFTAAGFEPNVLTVAKGQILTFTNTTPGLIWPASARHPTHTVYPGSDIAKCGTAEAAVIFDACKGLAQGESWSFTFNEVGAWNYHDHLNPTKFGKIIVE